MSGFAGIICADGATPDTRLLQHMANRLVFRGPDSTQVWTRPGAGFCFTFLRTGPAPQANIQPCSLDGNVWLLGDVRLDGREDLRHELEEAGEPTEATATDEDLTLRVWRRWGTAGLAKLLGDFSFALWDAGTHELRCVRDFIGAKPLFHARAGKAFYFSNTLEALRLVPGISSNLDLQFIGDFLASESSFDAHRTVYRDVARLAPGHSLKYSNEGLSIRRYAQIPIEEPLWLKRPRDYVERFQALLEQAVGDRLPHDPSAIFLSGGLDSTSVAAVAAKTAKNRATRGLTRAYTVDCKPFFDDKESTLASLMATKLGLEMQVFSAGSCPPYKGLEDPKLHTPEPTHDPFLSLSDLQYRGVSLHSRVAFTGHGGDEILIGQGWPYFVYLLRRWRLGTIATSFGGYILKHRRIPPLRGGFRTRIRRWMGRTNPLAEIPPWMEPRVVKQFHLQERSLDMRNAREWTHPLHPIAYAGLYNGSWASALESEEAAWIGVPLESRAPLLDLRLLRFLLQVPPVPWCVEKELLRQAMEGILPDEIRLRPKTPLPIEPIDFFAANGSWRPLPLPKFAEELRTFVDFDKLVATLETSTGSSLWIALRPVSLSFWLKGVENTGWIR